MLLKPFDIQWFDAGREPECAPNPLYPEGIDLDPVVNATKKCTASLPYPAERCGYYVITCNTCGVIQACTTAGRPDDPRSMRMACKAN